MHWGGVGNIGIYSVKSWRDVWWCINQMTWDCFLFCHDMEQRGEERYGQQLIDNINDRQEPELTSPSPTDM